MRRTPLVALGFLLAACAAAHAKCPVDTIVVMGQVEAPPHNARVHVRLIFARKKPGETGEGIVQEDGAFNIPVQFFTLSRPGILGEWGERCERKPRSVHLALTQNGYERPIDEVTLDVKRNFKVADTGPYTPKSEIVLNRQY